MKKFIKLSVFALFIVVISACSSTNNNEKIVGKWRCDSVSIVEQSGLYEKICEANLKRLDEELAELKSVLDTCKNDSDIVVLNDLIATAEESRKHLTPDYMREFMKEQLTESAGYNFIFNADGKLQTEVDNEAVETGTWKIEENKYVVLSEQGEELKFEIVELSDKMILQLENKPVEDDSDFVLKTNFNFSKQ